LEEYSELLNASIKNYTKSIANGFHSWIRFIHVHALLQITIWIKVLKQVHAWILDTEYNVDQIRKQQQVNNAQKPPLLYPRL